MFGLFTKKSKVAQVFDMFKHGPTDRVWDPCPICLREIKKLDLLPAILEQAQQHIRELEERNKTLHNILNQYVDENNFLRQPR